MLTPTEFGGAHAVDGYGPGFFRVAGRVVQGHVLVRAQGSQPWGGLDDAAPFEALAGRVDVLFIGTGAQMAPIPAPLAQRLRDLGIAAEPMATPTAARSYNVTLSEGRRVACALIAL